MRLLRRLASVALLCFVAAPSAQAGCVCRCVNGVVQPICTNALDITPICAPTVCPITPPSITPIPAPRVPPIGTSSCRMAQVYNQRTTQYEWRELCQ